jgi:hypothetical protein
MLPRRSTTPPPPSAAGLDEPKVTSQSPGRESPELSHSPSRPLQGRVDEHIPSRDLNPLEVSEPSTSNHDVVMSAPEDSVPRMAVSVVSSADQEAKPQATPMVLDQRNFKPTAIVQGLTATSSVRAEPSSEATGSIMSSQTVSQAPTRPSTFAPPIAPRNFGNPPSGPRAEANLPRGPRQSFSSSYVSRIRTEDTAAVSRSMDVPESPVQTGSSQTTVPSTSFKKPGSPQISHPPMPALPEIEIPPFRLPHEIADERERLTRDLQNMNPNNRPRWEQIKDLEKIVRFFGSTLYIHSKFLHILNCVNLLRTD